MSIRDQLRELVELQAAELAARDLTAELGLLPGERSQLERRIEGARSLVAEAESDREAGSKARRALETELQAAEAKVDKYRDQEMLVRTNDQLWALQAEIKTVQDKIDAIESQILEEMERADARAGAIAERRADLEVAETEVRAGLAAIDSRQSELEAAGRAARGRIDEIRAGIPADLLSIYDRIRAVRGGVGVAEVIDGNCGGCHVRLRPQLALEALNMEQPQQCDNCKRVLFYRSALELPSSIQVGTVE